MSEIGRFMQTAANRDYSKFWQDPKSFPAMMQAPKPPLEPREHSTVENYIRCVTGNQPYWMPFKSMETQIVWPDAMEEHPVPETVDGYDWWGVYWQWVPSAGGSITKPGTRVIHDMANWENDVEWPDLSLVDFETDGKKIAANLDPNRVHIYECVEGLTERLHEMMPFEEFLLSFYTEPEALERFLQKMADYKIESCEKIFKYYGRVDGICYHDDWGTQRAGFYSNEMFREQIMPATKRFFDYVKSQGKFIELHSCGKNIQYCEEMIELGIDMWSPQLPINDPDELYQHSGTRMGFAFNIPIAPTDTEEQIRLKVDEFVEKYGATGRVMASAWAAPAQSAIAADELYKFSTQYYNKLYKR